MKSRLIKLWSYKSDQEITRKTPKKKNISICCNIPIGWYIFWSWLANGSWHQEDLHPSLTWLILQDTFLISPRLGGLSWLPWHPTHWTTKAVIMLFIVYQAVSLGSYLLLSWTDHIQSWVPISWSIKAHWNKLWLQATRNPPPLFFALTGQR